MILCGFEGTFGVSKKIIHQFYTNFAKIIGIYSHLYGIYWHIKVLETLYLSHLLEKYFYLVAGW